MQRLNSLVCVLVAVGAFSASAGSVPATRHDSAKCRHRSSSRWYGNQGTLLLGTRQTWTEESTAEERTSVLASANLDGDAAALRLHDGHLVGKSVVGSVVQGESSGGQPVEVAICGAEPAPGDAGVVWYRIEAWNPVARDWENPCVATRAVPDPRALVLAGTWDATGAHRDDARKITFACEAGALGKCVAWGYKPWASVNGKSLADTHQACTRMLRADYCGNGRSHTQPGIVIDYYDPAGVASRTTRASAAWNPAQASFEAAWATDGASCLSRTRDGRALEEVLHECPGRFKAGAVDLGDGDQCLKQRTHPSTALLRNRSIPGSAGTTTSN
jgi:hypothetical protein